LGYRPYGYIAFEYDLTPYINYNGRNVITVKLDNSSQPGSRWYTGTGIYRNVTLKIRDNLYIPTWSLYVTTPVVQEDEAQINYEVKVKNEYMVPKDFNIQISLFDPSGNVVNTISHPENLEANAEGEFTYTMPVNNPLLWSPENPHLYQVVCNIYDEGQKIGVRKVKTGIRGMQYDANRGFILNGKKVVLNGVCMHHDGGPLGAACYRRTYEREIETLKEMGCNAIRTSHNPYASEFLDVCDSMGILVMAEAFDVWEEMKKPRVFLEDGSAKRIAIDQYHKEFPEWSNRDLRDMILRDRNHPSVFMWSIGNEIPEMREEAGVPITKRLGAIVHEYDYRPFTNGTNYRHPANQEAVSATDIAGYNYATHEILVADHKDFPDRKMIITECSSAQPFRARGEYYLKSQIPHQHDILWKGVKRNRINRRDEFGQGIDSYLGIKGKPYVMGMFIWTGKDYLGEITPYSWPARSSSFGVIDLCGFKKIGYYFYQSLWTDKPVMKIYPHWNWEGHEGEMVSVKCFSNADEIELSLNGTSLGKQKNNLSNGIIPEWDVPYEKGELQAKGFKNGNKISEDRVVTAKEPANIRLTSRKDYLNHNGKDLVYVECEVLDEDGNPCPKANNMIHFEIEGDAKIIGVGNGYNKSHEPFQANYRKAYNGKCLAILKSGTQGGVVKISASADGLQAAELLIRDKKNL
jgi:beta-galactosidase